MAISTTKMGMRISGGISARVYDTRALQTTMTKVVASPMPRPLVAVPVTASKGQSPIL